MKLVLCSIALRLVALSVKLKLGPEGEFKNFLARLGVEQISVLYSSSYTLIVLD